MRSLPRVVVPLAALAVVVAVVGAAVSTASGDRPAEASRADQRQERATSPASLARSLLPAKRARPTVETRSWPVGGSFDGGDVSDDSAIYANPTSPARSVVVADNKDPSVGGIGVYSMSGRLLQFRQGGQIGNVDLRPGFSLGGRRVVLAGANNRTNDSQEFWVLNRATRKLSATKSRGTLATQADNYGYCMYKSPTSGRFYSFVTATDGVVRQYRLFNSGGQVAATRVRTFDVGGQTEGCAADDRLRKFYAAEEDGSLWKYNAEPTGGSTRKAVVTAGAGGTVADLEGVSIAYGKGNAGYVYLSSQGNDTIKVYHRVTGALVRSITVPANGSIDAVGDTDGLDVTGANLGPGFRYGALVVHDEMNSGGTTSNLKYVPLVRR